MTTPKPPIRSTWPAWIIVGLAILAVVVMLVFVAVSTWRLAFPQPPRPPAPTYVCVYVTEHGSTTVTGSTPCPAVQR